MQIFLFPGTGKVYIYFGQAALGPSTSDPMIISQEFAADKNGISVAGSPLLATQGVFPLFFGASESPFGGDGAGSAYILSKNVFGAGSLHGLPVFAVSSDQIIRSPFAGFGLNGGFGAFMKSGGDVNANGSADLLIGAPLASTGGTNSGAVSIFW